MCDKVTNKTFSKITSLRKWNYIRSFACVWFHFYALHISFYRNIMCRKREVDNELFNAQRSK